MPGQNEYRSSTLMILLARGTSKRSTSIYLQTLTYRRSCDRGRHLAGQEHPNCGVLGSWLPCEGDRGSLGLAEVSCLLMYDVPHSKSTVVKTKYMDFADIPLLVGVDMT